MIDIIKGILYKLNFRYECQEEDTMLTVIMVTLPFLDRHNDHIQFYITDIEDQTFKMSDDGYIGEEFGLKESLVIQTVTAQLLASELNVVVKDREGRWEICCGFEKDLIPDIARSIETRILQYVQALIVFEGLLCLPIQQRAKSM